MITPAVTRFFFLEMPSLRDSWLKKEKAVIIYPPKHI